MEAEADRITLGVKKEFVPAFLQALPETQNLRANPVAFAAMQAMKEMKERGVEEIRWRSVKVHIHSPAVQAEFQKMRAAARGVMKTTNLLEMAPGSARVTPRQFA